MSASLNEVNLIGNLTRDPDIRSTEAGKKIANFTVATSESWKGADGEKKERAEFHRVVVFNEGLAGVVEKYIKKGMRVYVKGKLSTRKWVDKDGAEKYTTEIVLQGFGSELIMLGGKSDAPAEERAAPAASAKQAAMELDDEIPF